MDEDTIAIKIASGSATKERFKPSGKFILYVRVWPERMPERAEAEKTKEARTKIKARKFLSFSDSNPANGSKNAPKTGTKITVKKKKLLSAKPNNLSKVNDLRLL